jgi:hypothetical protein
MLLDEILKFNTCPVCKSKLDTVLKLTTNYSNSHSYFSDSKNYPLIFRKAATLGDLPNELEINKKDILNYYPFRTEIFTQCISDRYDARLYEGVYSIYQLDNKIKIDAVIEHLYIYNYTISNWHYDTNLSIPRSFTSIQKLYDQPMRIPVRSYDYWHLESEKSFKETLDKLLILL